MRWLRTISYFMVVGIFIWVWKTQQPILKDLSQTINLSLLMNLGACHLALVSLGAIPLYLFTHTLTIPLKLYEAVSLNFVSNLLNHLLPYRPGFGFRYLYFKRQYAVPFATFSAVSTTCMTLSMLVGISFGLIGWSICSRRPDLTEANPILLLGIFLFLILSILPWVARRWYKQGNSRFLGATVLLSHAKQPIIRATVSLCLSFFTAAQILSLCFSAIGKPAPLSLCFFLLGMISLISSLQITPGNIGLTESLIGSATLITHGSFTIGFTAYALFRVSQFIVNLCIGTPISLCCLHLIKKKTTSTKGYAHDAG